MNIWKFKLKYGIFTNTKNMKNKNDSNKIRKKKSLLKAIKR